MTYSKYVLTILVTVIHHYFRQFLLPASEKHGKNYVAMNFCDFHHTSEMTRIAKITKLLYNSRNGEICHDIYGCTKLQMRWRYTVTLHSELLEFSTSNKISFIDPIQYKHISIYPLAFTCCTSKLIQPASGYNPYYPPRLVGGRIVQKSQPPRYLGPGKGPGSSFGHSPTRNFIKQKHTPLHKSSKKIAPSRRTFCQQH